MVDTIPFIMSFGYTSKTYNILPRNWGFVHIFFGKILPFSEKIFVVFIYLR